MFGNVIKSIVDEIRYLIMDWYKYMDTTVPPLVNRKMFTHLKYANKNRIKDFKKKYPIVDVGLLEKHALQEYLRKSDEEIIEDMGLYYGELRYEIVKGNGRSS